MLRNVRHKLLHIPNGYNHNIIICLYCKETHLRKDKLAAKPGGVPRFPDILSISLFLWPHAFQNQSLRFANGSTQLVALKTALKSSWGKPLTRELCGHSCSCEMRSCSNLIFISLINKSVPVHWPLSRNAKDIKQLKRGFCVPSVWSIFWSFTNGDIILFVPHGKTHSFIHWSRLFQVSA